MASPENISVYIILMLVLLGIVFIIWLMASNYAQQSPSTIKNTTTRLKDIVSLQNTDISVQCSKTQEGYLYTVNVKGKATYPQQSMFTSSVDFKNTKVLSEGQIQINPEGSEFNVNYLADSKEPPPLDKRQTTVYQGPMKIFQSLFLGKFLIKYENQVSVKIPYINYELTECRNYFKVQCPYDNEEVMLKGCEKDCSTNINLCGVPVNLGIIYLDRNDCGSKTITLTAKVSAVSKGQYPDNKLGEYLALSLWSTNTDFLGNTCWKKTLSEFDSACLDLYRGPDNSIYIITPDNYVNNNC